jgi:hypothetical protein
MLSSDPAAACRLRVQAWVTIANLGRIIGPRVESEIGVEIGTVKDSDRALGIWEIAGNYIPSFPVHGLQGGEAAVEQWFSDLRQKGFIVTRLD